MKKIDIFFLKCFQKISDWFQLYVGITNFSFSRVTTTLFAASYVIYEGLSFIAGISKSIDVIGIFFIVFYGLVLFFRSVSVEKECMAKPQYMNSLVKILEPLRKLTIGVYIFFFVLVIVLFAVYGKSVKSAETNRSSNTSSISFLYYCLCFISWFCNLYFLSCTPKPPSKSRFKKLLEDIGNLFKKKALAKA